MKKAAHKSPAAVSPSRRSRTAPGSNHKYHVLFHEMFNRMPSGIAIYKAVDKGDDFIFKDFNPAAEMIEKVSRQAVVGKRVTRVFPAVKKFGLLAVFQEVWRTGAPQYFPQAFYKDKFHPGGWRENWVFKLQSGEIVAIYNDITARKQMEEALRESEQVFNTAFHAIPDPVALSTVKDGRFIEINDAFVSQMKFSREEVVGHTSVELNIWENPEDRRNAIQILTRDKRLYNFETRLRRKTGEVFPALFSVRLISIHGELSLITIAHDMTAVKKAEAEREELNRELQWTNQELETLIRIASHDLRSPLVNIQGFNQILNKAASEMIRISSGAGLPDDQRQALAAAHEKAGKAIRFINVGVTKLNGLINGLLRLSRLGRAPINIQMVDINALVSSLLESMDFQIGTAKAEIITGVLPPCNCDAALINEVFSNLLDNAIKYRDSQRPLRVRIWGRQEDRRVVYCIEDNGSGVVPEHRQRIWDLFYRPNSLPGVAGEGVGLTAVKWIVGRHGGAAWMESEAGAGSRFFVALPNVEEKTEP